MRKYLPFLMLFLAACAPSAPAATATPSPLPFFTATLPVTATQAQPPTMAAPTSTPSQPAPGLSALTTVQVNVRAAPSANSAALKLLPAGVQVQLTGRDSAGAWIQILAPESASGLGWVTAVALEIPGGVETLPVATDSPAAATLPVTPTPAFRASVTSQINVRRGPAASFESLGLLEANTPVALTGVNQISTWYQIEYAGGENGRAWVAAAYLKIEGQPAGLPIFDTQGKPLGGEAGTTPTPPPASYSAAPEDVDSAESPAVRLTFAPSGPRLIAYSSDLSAPFGDAADWLEFTVTTPQDGQATILYFSLKCEGNGAINAELRQNGLLAADFPGLLCGQYDVAVRVLGGQPALLKLAADGAASDIRYVRYTLTISTQP
ncbi:MAG: hypothetical protein OHK0031_11520 [Anaerolineales bacterium]